MLRPSVKSSSSGQCFAIFSRISLFWRFQCGGWLAFLIASFPLKLVILDSWEAAFAISIYREGIGFLTTWGMREMYRRAYKPSMGWTRFCGLITVVSLVGAGTQAILVLGFHDVIDYEEEKLFRDEMVFAVLYFRGGICFAWSFLYFGIKFWRETAARELRLAMAESEKRQAELQMLRAQMNPHFLFNALTSIHSGVGNPEADPRETIEALTDFLRFSLENRKADFIPIEKEFEAMRSYLAVEKSRFREELEVECSLGEDSRQALVPGIVLQPLIENAIKYGRRSSPRPLRIRVNIEHESGNLLKIEVGNTGEWRQTGQSTEFGGVGLSNLRSRLALTYSNKGTLDIRAEGGWVTMVIKVPFTYASDGSTGRNR